MIVEVWSPCCGCMFQISRKDAEYAALLYNKGYADKTILNGSSMLALTILMMLHG